ncbi:hypothetical protein HHS_05370 [Candidatus Pantoea carbekii]|uniref:Uncharacterized protein n=1 Tax=Candidatus Pantoea carbekii TaxID=1235990 RepID=U3U7U2_9GAMM|nr:hypothetical protein HHS_05370 [Candidatus Pantoea carbekii]
MFNNTIIEKKYKILSSIMNGHELYRILFKYYLKVNTPFWHKTHSYIMVIFLNNFLF